MTHKTFCYEYPRPMVTVDAFVVAPAKDGLSVLLIKRGHEPFAGQWALPGGFVDMDEDLAVAAQRELLEETHIELQGFFRLGTFGQPGRDPRGRTITAVFGRYVPEIIIPRAGDDASEAAWFPVKALPLLAFDHHAVIVDSLLTLFGEMLLRIGWRKEIRDMWHCLNQLPWEQFDGKRWTFLKELVEKFL